MAHFHSPRVVSDSLVMYYDTGNALKSYRGEPTTNLATDTPSQGGWGGTYEVLNSSTKAFRFIINNFAANPGAGWRSFTWDLRAYTGQSVTISATVEVPATSPGTFAWIMMGQGNTYTNNSGAGGYLGYSATSERVYKSDTVKERITWSGIIGNTGTANQPSGHIGFTVWYNNGTPGINSYVEVSNVQIEIKSHATPFVNGTRSVTEGLLDMMGNHSINLTNVSFDSNAEMTFDGTNDSIQGIPTSYSHLNPSAIEFVVTPGTTGKKMTVGGYRHNQGYSSPTIGMVYIETDNKFYASVITAAEVYRFVVSTSTIQSNRTYHVVFNKDTINGVMQMYVNGILEGTQTFNVATYAQWSSAGSFIGSNVLDIGKSNNTNSGQGWSGDFLQGRLDLFKLYGKILTAQEVAQNYQAVKSRFGI